MSKAQTAVLEYEASVAATRRFLERIPDDKLGWRPDPKSMTLGQLGLHLARASGRISYFMVQDSVERPENPFPDPASTAEILAALDDAVATVRTNLWDLSDEQVAGSCSMVSDGKVLVSFPRAWCLRDLLLNHNYHHRGQLSVYLRLLGISVPSAFGPTADEPFKP